MAIAEEEGLSVAPSDVVINTPSPLVSSRRISDNAFQTKVSDNKTKNETSINKDTTDTKDIPELPENWATATSDDGEIYYYNKVTNETTWKKPSL